MLNPLPAALTTESRDEHRLAHDTVQDLIQGILRNKSNLCKVLFWLVYGPTETLAIVHLMAWDMILNIFNI